MKHRKSCSILLLFYPLVLIATVHSIAESLVSVLLWEFFSLALLSCSHRLIIEAQSNIPLPRLFVPACRAQAGLFGLFSMISLLNQNNLYFL